MLIGNDNDFDNFTTEVMEGGEHAAEPDKQ